MSSCSTICQFFFNPTQVGKVSFWKPEILALAEVIVESLVLNPVKPLQTHTVVILCYGSVNILLIALLRGEKSNIWCPAEGVNVGSCNPASVYVCGICLYVCGYIACMWFYVVTDSFLRLEIRVFFFFFVMEYCIVFWVLDTEQYIFHGFTKIPTA